MKKNLIFERGLDVGRERVALRLFRTTHGFSLERRVIERDHAAYVQVLPIIALGDLDRFADADPYSKELAALYYEVRRHLLENHVGE